MACGTPGGGAAGAGAAEEGGVKWEAFPWQRGVAGGVAYRANDGGAWAIGFTNAVEVALEGAGCTIRDGVCVAQVCRACFSCVCTGEGENMCAEGS